MEDLQRYDLVGNYGLYMAKQEYGNWVDGDDADARIADLEAELATQKKTIADHENDCAILPEDRSVTEYVEQLNAELAKTKLLYQSCQDALSGGINVDAPHLMDQLATANRLLDEMDK